MDARQGADAMARDTMVELHGVRKTFGTNEVLHGIDLTVRICEPLGDETDVMLDGPGGSNFTARLKLDAVPAPGSSMTLGPKPGGLHLFDTATGERLA